MFIYIISRTSMEQVKRVTMIASSKFKFNMVDLTLRLLVNTNSMSNLQLNQSNHQFLKTPMLNCNSITISSTMKVIIISKYLSEQLMIRESLIATSIYMVFKGLNSFTSKKSWMLLSTLKMLSPSSTLLK
jgi:hypothetical protein